MKGIEFMQVVTDNIDNKYICKFKSTTGKKELFNVASGIVQGVKIIDNVLTIAIATVYNTCNSINNETYTLARIKEVVQDGIYYVVAYNDGSKTYIQFER